MIDVALLLTDSHANFKALEVIIGMAEASLADDIRVVKIIHCGDIGYYPRVTSDVPKSNHFPGIPRYFIRGNHEDHTALPLDAKEPQSLEHLQDWQFIPDGYLDEDGILYVGGAWSIDGEWRREQEVVLASHGLRMLAKWHPDLEECSEEKFEEIRNRYSPSEVKTLITHDAPFKLYKDLCNPSFGPVKETLTGRELQKLVDHYKPYIHIFGHHHKDFTYSDGITTFRCLDQIGGGGDSYTGSYCILPL